MRGVPEAGVVSYGLLFQFVAVCSVGGVRTFQRWPVDCLHTAADASTRVAAMDMIVPLPMMHSKLAWPAPMSGGDGCKLSSS